MIRHCVWVRFHPHLEDTAIASLLQEFVELGSKIQGIRSVQTGANVSPEGLNRGFRHGFSIDFENASSRDEYLVHPAHQKLASKLVAHVDGGVEGVLVFDMDLA